MVECAIREEDRDVIIFATIDEALGQIALHMEREMPDHRINEIGLPLAPPRHRRIQDRKARHGLTVRERQGQGHHRSDVMPADGVTLETECSHYSVHVFGKACLVIAALGAVGMTRSAQIEGDHGVPFGEHWHDLVPFPPGLRKAVEENERRPIATDDSMDLYVACTQHLVTEVV